MMCVCATFWYIFCAGLNLCVVSEKLLFTPFLNDNDNIQQ